MFPMRLAVNQTQSFSILSKEYWNDTEVEICGGEEYLFKAIGTWKDARTNCSANGYVSKCLSIFSFFKRSKKDNWFALMGSLNRQKSLLLIGEENIISFTNSGTFSCFANDLPGFYWNNSGFVLLYITRLK
jgi:hypothetical protein